MPNLQSIATRPTPRLWGLPRRASWATRPRWLASGPLAGLLTSASLVRTVWAASLLVNLWIVACFGRNVPYHDDWPQVSRLVGAEPLTSDWLLRQHVEHRIVLPKLITLVVFRLLGPDYRLIMVLNVLLFAAAALVLVTTAERVRGRSSLADLLFPIACLGLGHLPNVLWCFQLCYVLPAALACGLLALIVRSPGGLSWRAACFAGALLAGQTLSFSSGAILVSAASLWLAACGVSAWRTGARARGIGILALALLNLALVVGCALRLQVRPSHVPSLQEPGMILQTAAKAMTLAAGPGALSVWPVSCAVLLSFLAATMSLLLVSFRRQPADRLRVFGLGVFLGGALGTALAIGYVRASLGSQALGFNAGAAPRYATLMLPLICALPFGWLLWKQTFLCSFGPLLLAGLAAALVVPNSRFGLQYARSHRDLLAAFEADVAAGWPLPDLAARHGATLNGSEAKILRGLKAFQAVGIAPYAGLSPISIFRSQPLALEPRELHDLEWRADRYVATGPNPYLVFSFSAQHVEAVKFRVSGWNPLAARASLKLFWRLSPVGFDERNSVARQLPGNRIERPMTFAVRAMSDGIRLDLEAGLNELTIDEIVLLTKPE